MIVNEAIAAGGTHPLDPIDHDSMDGWSLRRPDGHHWEVVCMGPAAVQR